MPRPLASALGCVALFVYTLSVFWFINVHSSFLSWASLVLLLGLAGDKGNTWRHGKQVSYPTAVIFFPHTATLTYLVFGQGLFSDLLLQRETDMWVILKTQSSWVVFICIFWLEFWWEFLTLDELGNFFRVKAQHVWVPLNSNMGNVSSWGGKETPFEWHCTLFEAAVF